MPAASGETKETNAVKSMINTSSPQLLLIAVSVGPSFGGKRAEHTHSPPNVERSVEEGGEVEEGRVRVPLAQPGHAHGEAGEEQEE